MKKLKKILMAMILILVPMTLLACSSTSQKTYIKDQDQVIVDYKGDTVHKITLKSTRTFDELGITSKDEAETILKRIGSVFEEHEDVFEFKSSIDGQEASYTVSMDTKKMNEIDFSNSDLFYGVEDYTSLKEVEENFTIAGYEEKK